MGSDIRNVLSCGRPKHNDKTNIPIFFYCNNINTIPYLYIMAKFKVNGLKELQRELTAMERTIPKEVDVELKKIADGILADAVGRVHVLSGHLKSTAFVEKIEGGYTIGFSASYSAFEEFGTGQLVEVPNGYEDFALSFRVSGGRIRNGEPHPFLFPAFFKERDDIVNKLEKALNGYLKSK